MNAEIITFRRLGYETLFTQNEQGNTILHLCKNPEILNFAIINGGKRLVKMKNNKGLLIFDVFDNLDTLKFAREVLEGKGCDGFGNTCYKHVCEKYTENINKLIQINKNPFAYPEIICKQCNAMCYRFCGENC